MRSRGKNGSFIILVVEVSFRSNQFQSSKQTISSKSTANEFMYEEQINSWNDAASDSAQLHVIWLNNSNLFKMTVILPLLSVPFYAAPLPS